MMLQKAGGESWKDADVRGKTRHIFAKCISTPTTQIIIEFWEWKRGLPHEKACFQPPLSAFRPQIGPLHEHIPQGIVTCMRDKSRGHAIQWDKAR